MAELEGQGSPDIVEHAGRRDRQQFLAETAGGEARDEIGKAVDHQQPHRRKVPEQSAAEPAAERVVARKAETEQRRGVVDLPTRQDHQDHGEGVDPVHDPDPGRLDHFGRGGADLLVGDSEARHDGSPVLNIV
ncbi:hypothetical protein ACVWWO_004482 [Bradyrhizobium sp. F1.13.1]